MKVWILFLASVVCLTACAAGDIEEIPESIDPTFVLVGYEAGPQGEGVFPLTCDGLADAAILFTQDVLDEIGNQSIAQLSASDSGYSDYFASLVEPRREQLLETQRQLGCLDAEMSTRFVARLDQLTPHGEQSEQFLAGKPPGPIVVPPPTGDRFVIEHLWDS